MESIRQSLTVVNVHPAERVASVLSGGAMTISGLRQGGLRGIASAAVGAVMIHRGVTGHCHGYRLLGYRSAPSSAALPYELGIRARAAITIDAPRQDLFRFWRHFENLPRFMSHVQSVERIGENRTRWTAQGPAGKQVTWDAELINEIPGELIAWKSLPGSQVANAGSVRFKDAPGGRGTEVRVELQYNPPAGVIGAYIARLFGRDPEQEITSDLGRLKQHMEGGEIATTEGQPQGGTSKEKFIGKKLEEAFQ
jgi:uncharacterized membrane protein